MVGSSSPPRIFQGASERVYDPGDGGLAALRRRYDDLVLFHGGLAPALVAIASMLDIPAVAAREGLRPDVVPLLIEAADALTGPPPTAPAAVIAYICHEANRAYCQTLGDNSQPTWPLAPDWQRASVIEGVEHILAGRAKSPEEAHGLWLIRKEKDGWRWGPHKDPVAKTHPNLTAYENLPIAEQRKDALFFAIVRALSGRA